MAATTTTPTDTDWSDFGACESCGAVAGWACHRGKRQLKNAHAGRPRTGQEPYVAPAADWPLAGEDREHLTTREAAVQAGAASVAELGAELAAEPWGPAPAYDGPSLGPITPPAPCCDTWHPAGTTCPDPYLAPETTKEATVAGGTLENAERYPSNPTGKRRVDAEVPKDIERDQYDRPKLVRAVQGPDGAWQISPTGEVEGYTRASTLGSALESQEGLSIWRGGMIVYGMSRRKDLVLAAQAIPGTEDKKLHRRPLYEIAEKAKEAAEASSAATVGTALHALTEQADQGRLAVDIGEYQPVLDAYLEKMTGWKVVRSETFVVSDYFHAAGSFDRLITPTEPMALVDQHTGEIITVIMPGDLVVVDLKTSTTADYFGAKFFAQLAVYVTGQDYDRNPDSPTYGQRTPLGQRTDFALILHIPQGGDADSGEPVADWFWLDMRAGLALAQLACVVQESRKKRFSRTHMRPVHAQPIDGPMTVDPVSFETRRAVTDQPGGAVPARDPLGDEHLAITSDFIAEAESFPAAEADLVDAELAEDGRMPEERTATPAALATTNAGGPDTSEYRARIAAGTMRSTISTEHLEEAVPGPEETAPLPDGWESRAEQDVAKEVTTSVPKRLGAQLQESAARHKVEAALIRAIERATSVRGPGGLTDLYERASKAGYWSDRVKAAASARKKELAGRGGSS